MAGGYSYNGWPANSDPNAIGVVKSQWFPGGVKDGDVATVLRYVVEQLHARVEPIIDGWNWGYTYKQNVNNPSSLSCHASGTAVDYNAPNHPNGSAGTFTDDQVGTIYAILDECQGAVSWLEGYDEMHFEIQVDAGTLAAIAAQLPAGGAGPAPDDTEQDDDVMQLVRCNEDGAIYAAGPGVFKHIDQETIDCGNTAGLWDSSKQREMNPRERDVVAAFTRAPNA